MESTFPGRAVRDLTMRRWTVGNCSPDFTNFTLDFEPLPSGQNGYEFVSNLDYGFDGYHQGLHEVCAPAISRGVIYNLAGLPKPRVFGESATFTAAGDRLDGLADGPLIAVRVVLTRARYHEIDSAAAYHCVAAWALTQRLREELG